MFWYTCLCRGSVDMQGGGLALGSAYALFLACSLQLVNIMFYIVVRLTF
jgi:hypothetical protein